LNWRTTSLSQRSSTGRMYSNRSAEMLQEPGIQLPAIRNMVSFLPHGDLRTLKTRPHFRYASNPGSAPYLRQAQEHPLFLRGSETSTRATSTPVTEPTFATLLTAGRDMKTVLEAMDQELSPQDVLDFWRVDLARPPMPEEPVSDPDYKPRPSTVTGRAPVDPRHSKKETDRRAQHKHYLDLSEIKIPDFFLKLCGWDEPRDSASKRTPRTKSSVLQAGCLYTWFLSGPVLRCFKSLLHNNRRLEEEVQRLENENHGLHLRCESLQSKGQVRAEHINTAVGKSSLKSPSLTLTGSHCSPSSSDPSLSGFTILEEPGFSVKPDTQLCLLSGRSMRAQSKSVKRRSPSVSPHREAEPTSPPKKRKTNSNFIDKRDEDVRLTFDEEKENSLSDIDSVRDQNKDDFTPTQMYRLRLSSAPSLQSAISSCWDSASAVSVSSSWDQPSPHSISDSWVASVCRS
jgi:hypothetical protein